MSVVMEPKPMDPDLPPKGPARAAWAESVRNRARILAVAEALTFLMMSHVAVYGGAMLRGEPIIWSASPLAFGAALALLVAFFGWGLVASKRLDERLERYSDRDQ